MKEISFTCSLVINWIQDVACSFRMYERLCLPHRDCLRELPWPHLGLHSPSRADRYHFIRAQRKRQQNSTSAMGEWGGTSPLFHNASRVVDCAMLTKDCVACINHLEIFWLLQFYQGGQVTFLILGNISCTFKKHIVTANLDGSMLPYVNYQPQLRCLHGYTCSDVFTGRYQIILFQVLFQENKVISIVSG